MIVEILTIVLVFLIAFYFLKNCSFCCERDIMPASAVSASTVGADNFDIDDMYDDLQEDFGMPDYPSGLLYNPSYHAMGPSYSPDPPRGCGACGDQGCNGGCCSDPTSFITNLSIYDKNPVIKNYIDLTREGATHPAMPDLSSPPNIQSQQAYFSTIGDSGYNSFQSADSQMPRMAFPSYFSTTGSSGYDDQLAAQQAYFSTTGDSGYNSFQSADSQMTPRMAQPSSFSTTGSSGYHSFQSADSQMPRMAQPSYFSTTGSSGY